MKILVTDNSSFIGSAVIRYIINNTQHNVINIDKLTYTGNLKSLDPVSNNKRYDFEKVIINVKAIALEFS